MNVNKKIIISIIVFAIMGITFLACEKTETTEPVINIEQSSISISDNEIREIISSLHSTNKTPSNWWDDIKAGAKVHTGGTQVYVNGQPICSGNYNCGSCPAICLTGRTINGSLNGPNGELDKVTNTDYNLGYRALSFTIIENYDTEERKIMIEFKEDYDDFVRNGKLYVDKDFELTDDILEKLELTSATIFAGEYEVVDEGTGIYYTVVDSEMEEE